MISEPHLLYLITLGRNRQVTKMIRLPYLNACFASKSGFRSSRMDPHSFRLMKRFKVQFATIAILKKSYFGADPYSYDYCFVVFYRQFLSSLI